MGTYLWSSILSTIKKKQFTQNTKTHIFDDIMIKNNFTNVINIINLLDYTGVTTTDYCNSQ